MSRVSVEITRSCGHTEVLEYNLDSENFGADVDEDESQPCLDCEIKMLLTDQE